MQQMRTLHTKQAVGQAPNLRTRSWRRGSIGRTTAPNTDAAERPPFATGNREPGASDMRKAFPLVAPALREAGASCAHLTQVKARTGLPVWQNAVGVRSNAHPGSVATRGAEAPTGRSQCDSDPRFKKRSGVFWYRSTREHLRVLYEGSAVARTLGAISADWPGQCGVDYQGDRRLRRS